MRELLVDTCRTEDEAGANHTFAYYILVDQMELGDGFACESYGVKVVGEEGETACIPHITVSVTRIDALMELLRRNTVAIPSHRPPCGMSWTTGFEVGGHKGPCG